MPLGRGSHESYSEKYADGETPHAAFNKNVEWLRYSYVWWIYAALVVSATTVLRMLLEGSKYRDLGTVLTVTHTINNLIFFYAFHWAKGSPDHLAQGEFNGQTLWEQIDGGIPWTKTKKIFFLIHTLLVFAASYASDYQLDYLLINIPVWLLLGTSVGESAAQIRRFEMENLCRSADMYGTHTVSAVQSAELTM